MATLCNFFLRWSSWVVSVVFPTMSPKLLLSNFSSPRPQDKRFCSTITTAFLAATISSCLHFLTHQMRKYLQSHKLSASLYHVQLILTCEVNHLVLLPSIYFLRKEDIWRGKCLGALQWAQNWRTSLQSLSNAVANTACFQKRQLPADRWWFTCWHWLDLSSRRNSFSLSEKIPWDIILCSVRIADWQCWPSC